MQVNKAKILIEQYGLFKKRDILKVEYKITGSEDNQVYKLEDLINEVKDSLPIEINLEKTTKDGELRYYEFKLDKASYKNEDTYIMIVNDITEIKRNEEQRALTKFKALMFASMTHEIRTPLNAIINSWDVISTDPYVTDSIKNWVEICKSSASLLMYMTFNILDYSRMESGEFREEHIPFQIWTLLEKIALVCEPHARLKKLLFQLDIEEEIEDMQIFNDERRIIQVLLNLIMNSVKYTFKGKIRLKIRLINLSSVSNHGTIDIPYLVFSVIDTGQGITEDKQDKLFELFSNVDNYDYHWENTGIGLELTVSKNIVENMGGCLWFTSKLNVGSVFTFTIPKDLNEENDETCKKMLFNYYNHNYIL